MNKEHTGNIAPTGMVHSTEAERIAVAAAKLACQDTLNELFSSLGIDRANMTAMKEFRDDLTFIRNVREGAFTAGSRFALTLVTVFAGAFAYGMVQWLRAVLASR